MLLIFIIVLFTFCELCALHSVNFTFYMFVHCDYVPNCAYKTIMIQNGKLTFTLNYEVSSFQIVLFSECKFKFPSVIIMHCVFNIVPNVARKWHLYFFIITNTKEIV